jgi:hypothetical protein
MELEGIRNLFRVVERRESARPAVAVKFDNQHAVGISRQHDTAMGGEVVRQLASMNL